MHDGVAQVLGYMNVQLQTLNLLWKQGKQDEFKEEMTQMQRAVQSANADVRESILSLRTTLATDKGATAAMAEYIEEFGLQTGIEIQFQNRIDGEINLSSLAEVQLVCILQEALTNVRKHAHASQVRVHLDRHRHHGNEFVLLQVQDDGVGFETKESHQHFGIKTMGERAHSVNGEVQIQSKQNQGTTVLCHLPCLAQGKITDGVIYPMQKDERA
jgi:two-component system nitrate/nitrite sensor histidine kinase NarX